MLLRANFFEILAIGPFGQDIWYFVVRMTWFFCGPRTPFFKIFGLKWRFSKRCDKKACSYLLERRKKSRTWLTNLWGKYQLPSFKPILKSHIVHQSWPHRSFYGLRTLLVRPHTLCWPFGVNSFIFVGAVSSSTGAIGCAQTGMYRNIK